MSKNEKIILSILQIPLYDKAQGKDPLKSGISFPYKVFGTIHNCHETDSQLKGCWRWSQDFSVWLEQSLHKRS